MTRTCLVAALAILAILPAGGAAAQGEDGSRVAAIRERVVLSADVLRVARLAEACGRRDAAWSSRVLSFVISRQGEDAERFAEEVEGGRDAIRWMMVGARQVATAAADAEHDRYGEAACRVLYESGDVGEVDRLTAAEPG